VVAKRERGSLSRSKRKKTRERGRRPRKGKYGISFKKEMFEKSLGRKEKKIPRKVSGIGVTSIVHQEVKKSKKSKKDA